MLKAHVTVETRMHPHVWAAVLLCVVSVKVCV